MIIENNYQDKPFWTKNELCGLLPKMCVEYWSGKNGKTFKPMNEIYLWKQKKNIYERHFQGNEPS